MNTKNKLLILAVFLFPLTCFSEDFTASAFVDTYVATSTNDIAGSQRNYLTQTVKNNQYSINLASVTIAYDDSKVRAKLSPQIGDSVSVNYNSEPNDSFKYLQEGYLGYYVTEDTTLDVGVFLSHIGAESWLSKDNINYTRSFIAEFSPYYEAGAKLSHKFSETTSGQVLLLNGWQSISDERHPALGTQFSHKVSDLTIISNTFIGEESRSSRYFHDLVLSLPIADTFTLASSIDTGYQSNSNDQGGFWWGYAVYAKYNILEELSLNSRLEGYTDRNGIIVSTPLSNDFIVYGASLGADYSFLPCIKLKGEVRHLWSENDVFQNDSLYRNNDTIFTISLNIFDERKF